ncbi:hypothetical protein ACQ4PT_013642 [Festuca glaucescens]
MGASKVDEAAVVGGALQGKAFGWDTIGGLQLSMTPSPILTGRGAGLSFNLTLGVSSRSYGQACIEPGTYLEVSNHGALLAASEAEVGWLCAGPRKPAKQRVAARTTGVPESRELDSLAADMKQGAPLYEVTLHLPRGAYGVPYGAEGYWGPGWVSGCKATQTPSPILTGRGAGLSFNLTLGVSSRSYGQACIEPGTYLEVSYHGALLAASEAEVGWLCAGPRKPAKQRVAARTTGVPESRELDSLAADMKQGAPLYEVTLHLPRGSYGVPYGAEGYWGPGWVSGCKATQVGAAAVWCDAPDQMPGYFGG